MRKSQYFPFWMFSAKQGTTGTIFITSLVWRDPWLGIEPGTSRTRSQHYITRLSMRRLINTEQNRTWYLFQLKHIYIVANKTYIHSMHKWYYMKIEKMTKLRCENVKINRMIVIFTGTSNNLSGRIMKNIQMAKYVYYRSI